MVIVPRLAESSQIAVVPLKIKATEQEQEGGSAFAQDGGGPDSVGSLEGYYQ